MKNTLALFLITLMFISCKDEISKELPDYLKGKPHSFDYSDKNGNIIKKEYYTSDGELYSVVNYKDNFISNIKEFNNGELLAESEVDEDLNAIKNIYKNGIIDRVSYGKITTKGDYSGWWEVYDTQNKILEKIEFINYKGVPYYNQNYFYKNDGTIDSLKSTFFNLSFLKKKDKEYDCKVDFFTKDNFPYIAFCYSEEIDSDFSNVNDVHLDTLFVKKKKEGNMFPVKFKEYGLKTIRGFIVAYSKNNFLDSTSTDGVQFIKYFEKEILVE